MKKFFRILTAIVPFLPHSVCYSQPHWTFADASSCGATESWIIRGDHQNNMYVVTEVFDSLCISPYFFPRSPRGYDVSVTKYDSGGHMIWTKKSVAGFSQPIAFTTDHNNNSYLLGYFDDTVRIGPFSLTRPSGDSNSFYLAKFDTGGNAIWVKQGGQISGLDPTIPYGGLAVDLNNNIYIIGTFGGTAACGIAGHLNKLAPVLNIDLLSVSNHDPTGYRQDVFIAKYDPYGNVKWVKSFGGTYDEIGKCIAVSNTNKIYISGDYSSTPAYFGSVVLPLASGSGQNLFYAELDTNGNVIWAKSAYGSNANRSMAIDNDGNIYLGGKIISAPFLAFGTDTAFSGVYWYTGYIAKVDSAGNTMWVKSLPGVGATSPTEVHSLAVDNCNNIWASGYFTNKVTIAPGVFLDSLPASYDPLFLLQYDSSGALMEHFALRSGGDDQSALFVDRKNNTYIGGDFYVDDFVFTTDTFHLNTLLLQEYSYVARFRSETHYVYCPPPILTPGTTLHQPMMTKSNDISIFPNPTDDAFTIHCTAEQPGIALALYDLSGRVQRSYLLMKQTTTISTRDLAPGIYYCRISDGNNITVQKLVIIR